MLATWRGKTVVVTGAASGIGAATGGLLKERGARVIALDRREPDREIANDYIEFDQGDPASIEIAARVIPDPIDGFFNIAGVPPTTDGLPEDLLYINFFGLRLLTEKIAPMLSVGAGIVNMSSHAGWRWRENAAFLKQFLALQRKQGVAQLVRRAGVVIDGLGDRCAYPISKQLLNLWTAQSVASAVFGHVRMNAVSCAGVATPILEDFLKSFGAESAARIRSIGLARAEDIAPALVFLASPQARWIKGAVIPVDGGASAAGALQAIEL
ncbi:MAG TPA: 3-alpha-hydroxysteroid dehydrogenase [Parvularcula sp.]|nr:3-alpha-hydroxysteroid dehydrogenase [Parvularcula sp.]